MAWQFKSVNNKKRIKKKRNHLNVDSVLTRGVEHGAGLEVGGGLEDQYRGGVFFKIIMTRRWKRLQRFLTNITTTRTIIYCTGWAFALNNFRTILNTSNWTIIATIITTTGAAIAPSDILFDTRIVGYLGIKRHVIEGRIGGKTSGRTFTTGITTGRTGSASTDDIINPAIADDRIIPTTGDGIIHTTTGDGIISIAGDSAIDTLIRKVVVDSAISIIPIGAKSRIFSVLRAGGTVENWSRRYSGWTIKQTRSRSTRSRSGTNQGSDGRIGSTSLGGLGVNATVGIEAEDDAAGVEQSTLVFALQIFVLTTNLVQLWLAGDLACTFDGSLLNAQDIDRKNKSTYKYL